MKLFGLVSGVLLPALVMIAPLYGNEWVFIGSVPAGHRGPVNALIHKGNYVLSAGDDGFIERWDSRANAAIERFQYSPYRIIAMAERPGKDEICLVESDGMGLHRIAVWNYRERRNIFTLPFRDPIARVFYSMGGSFIIVARTGGTGLVLIDSTSGETLQSPRALTGTGGPTVGLAVTGRTERNMAVYLTSGVLSYWDLESGAETLHFKIPANLFSPVLFNSNRYFAGLTTEGLTVANAVSGELLPTSGGNVPFGNIAAGSISAGSISADSLLCASGDELLCLIQREESSAYAAAELYRFGIDRAGRIIMREHTPLTGEAAAQRFTAMTATANGIILGTADGSLVLVRANGQTHLFTAKDQTHITEIAVSGSSIAFLAEDGTMGFIPLNYGQLSAGRTIAIEQNEDIYSRITAFAAENGANGQFIFWQDNNTRTPPLIRSSVSGNKTVITDDLLLRSPVRMVHSFGGKILFMDHTGNLSVISPNAGENRPFTFFSVGLMDAAFIDRDRIILGRSAIAGNTPFLMINIDTGETVPLPFPTQAGVMLHRGASGHIYAVAVSSHTDGNKTSILQLNPADSVNSINLVEFLGEDTQFSLAESLGSIVATIGGEDAALYSGDNMQKLERTSGFPQQLFNSGQWIISLDRDGAIAWHESRSGKLLAVFRLHPNEWTLQTERGTTRGAAGN
ncbi:MAG: WD40 repeat domain-containing protein [Treponema sp.]|nr:WD40 repeat domain-containing protein [Treponema sp.]